MVALSCPLCEAAFTVISSLQRHFEKHTPCKIKCMCGQDFEFVRPLHTHLNRCKFKVQMKGSMRDLTQKTRAYLQQTSQTPLSELDEVEAELLYLIVFLGGSISEKFLLQLLAPKLSWNDEGGVETVVLEGISVAKDKETLNRAMNTLQQRRIVFREELTLIVPQDLVQKIESQTVERHGRKLKAIMAATHVFPEHRNLVPAYYTTIANVALAPLRFVLAHLEDIGADSLTPKQNNALIETCISSSYFLDIEWKEHVLGVAARMATTNQQAQGRIDLRRLAISRIAQNLSSSTILEKIRFLQSSFSPVDERTNAHYGEFLVFHARNLIDIERLREARQVLDSFHFRRSDQASWYERIQMNDIQHIQAEISQYEGQFLESYNSFRQLMHQEPTSFFLTSNGVRNKAAGQAPAPRKVSTRLSAVACEIGDFKYAVDTLRDEIANGGHSENSRNMLRLHLALGETYLMQAVNIAVKEKSDMKSNKISIRVLELCGRSRVLLEKLRPHFLDTTLVQRINQFRMLVAIAISEHLTGCPEHAISCWEKALKSSNAAWPKGYTDAIIAYSKADLNRRLGNQDDADRLETMAAEIYRTNERRYQFTGLGTIWPTYVTASLQIRFSRPPLF